MFSPVDSFHRYYGWLIEPFLPLPLPDDVVLSIYARAFNEAGHSAMVFDPDWALVYVTDEFHRAFPGTEQIGRYFWEFIGGPPTDDPDPRWVELKRIQFEQNFADVLAVVPGGRTELRSKVHPELVDLVDTAPNVEVVPAHSHLRPMSRFGLDLSGWSTTVRLYNDGVLAGFLLLQKPSAGMSAIFTVMGGGDTRHIERISTITEADRRPAAILFADLDASAQMSRRMSTEEYFTLARRLVRAADECVVEGGGVVGRHLGDGVTAFFLADTLGSETAAARACIAASRALRKAAAEVAARSDLDPSELTLRFGLHWGSTLYVGLLKTLARAEVTALGDEVNETARMEACASGGRTLASKNLIERLSKADRSELGIMGVAYSTLNELPTATEKARRDAPSISVCEIS